MDNLVAIYSEALPPSEQKPRTVLEEALYNKNYYFYVLNKNDKTVGFAIVYAPDYSDYYLLEYMAVDHTCRSEGLGGKIFDSLVAEFKNRHMVIEVESPHQPSPDYEQRLKRLAFYSRQGSKTIDKLKYILPLESHFTPPEMLLLLHSSTYVSSIPKTKLSEWVKDIYVAVYGCSPIDARLGEMLNKLPETIDLL